VDEIRAKAYLDASFTEYQAIRDEAVASTAEFFRIVQSGSTTVLGLMGVAATFWKTEENLTKVLLGAIIPTLSYVFIELLTGQVTRIRRAGRYCRSLERKLQLLIGDPFGLQVTNPEALSIGWESWIEGESLQQDKHLPWIYTFGIAIFFGTSYCSLIGYIFYVYKANCPNLTVALCLAEHRPSVAIAIALIVAECAKLAIWLAQATQIADPLKGLLFLPREIAWPHKMYNTITQAYSRFRSTSSLSGIIVVGFEALVLTTAFGIGAGIVILSVAACGTAASILRGRLADQRERPEKRSWRNALANAGVASCLAGTSLLWPIHSRVVLMAAMAMASLNATLSDTISHEVGVTFGGVPRLITTFRRVPPGSNGAVSVVGTYPSVQPRLIWGRGPASRGE